MERTFDLSGPARQNFRPYRRSSGYVYGSVALGVLTLFAVFGAVEFPRTLIALTALAIVTAFLAGVAFLIFFATRVKGAPSPTRLDLTDIGLTLTYPERPTPRVVRWDDPSLDVFLTHLGRGEGEGTYFWNEWSYPSLWLTADAFAALRDAAKAQGLSVAVHPYYGGYGERVRIRPKGTPDGPTRF